MSDARRLIYKTHQQTAKQDLPAHDSFRPTVKSLLSRSLRPSSTAESIVQHIKMMHPKGFPQERHGKILTKPHMLEGHNRYRKNQHTNYAWRPWHAISKENQLSSLGMNTKGEVRTASEFKDIFEESGQSFRPYKCPFCEVLYEDRCIVTECVKAPHFKLPDGTKHRNGCNGEAGQLLSTTTTAPSAATKRTVVGKIEIPEALVVRRKPSLVRKPGDVGLGAPPDAIEVVRRRRLIASDTTIASCYTTSQLRPIIHAYKRLRKHAYEQAIAAKLDKGSAEYNLKFRQILSDYDLALYGQKLSYGNAFQGCKLYPYRLERIYNGVGKVRIEDDYIIITDNDFWPKQLKSKTELAPFEVKLSRTLDADAPTSHVRAMEELEALASTDKNTEWYAYGLPALKEEKFELLLDSLNNLYWIGQHKP